MAAEVRQRRPRTRPPPQAPPEIEVELPESSPFSRIASGVPTPRSTLGSPLTSHAYRRSGVGDLAAGPRRHISLSEVELLPWLCCMAPVLCLFVNYSSVLVTSLFFPYAADMLTAALTCVTFLWIANLSVSSMLGAFKLREGCSTDWHVLLQQLPLEDRDGVQHIVLLPNYKENERMLKETLENLGRSRTAQSALRVVLAMEAREGPSGREKAARIMAEKGHLFADIFATYHPEGVPGEVAGKSSNTQWAFREALRRYGATLGKMDLSKVFLTVADADTLFHPQYFSALSYQGLLMEKEERSWTLWQSPVLLIRNLFTVPSVIRSSSHATLIFELAALANQYVFPAFAYSAYSTTLALASHPEVDGWDVDVIAEDHHMFCKCYFAALWELSHAAQETKKKGCDEEAIEIVPLVKVQPIFLPAISYLVESNDGYLASLYERFQQARRHMQGVVELGYVLLQWARLSGAVGFSKIPIRTHLSIFLIVIKMHMLHITSTSQCFALILAAILRVVPRIVMWVLSGGLGQLVQERLAVLGSIGHGWEGMNLAQQALVTSLGQISGVMLLYSITCTMVVSDCVEGRYHKLAKSAAPESPVRSMQRVSEEPTSATSTSEDEERTQGRPISPRSTDGLIGFELQGIFAGRRSWLWRIGLFLYIFSDTVFSGYPAMTFFAMVPVLLAGWSLFQRGTDFEYIVAAKPEFE
eukprot:TRINITY_DN10865_c0_g1_i3.p1 TRINITY_DN10865_c0_g1~~TRINITY_DN10865_c0_g1_i3.p1  ORF type:complete len:700 (+),score=116.41 TRINITY_DN10865_c0_g1_i3:48-2147(+)